MTRRFGTRGSMLQGIIEEVTKLAEQRTNSRFIMYVQGGSNFALKKIHGVDVMETLWFPKGNRIAEAATLRTRGAKCACTNKDTSNPTWNNLTEQQIRNGFTSLLLTSGFTTETHTRSYNPTKEEAATPRRLKNTLNTNMLHSERGNRRIRQASEPDADHWCGLHGHGHFHQGLHGRFLRHRLTTTRGC